MYIEPVIDQKQIAEHNYNHALARHQWTFYLGKGPVLF